MTAWGAFSAADFDARKADRQARQAADSGQAPLFVGATPTRATKQAATPEQLPGQDELFSKE